MKNLTFQLFLVADTQLYKRLCPSVRWSVRWSVTLELKMQETRIYNAAVVIECVWVFDSVWEGGWGEAGVWLPLPNRPQRYCDPASLVYIHPKKFLLIS